MTDPDARCEEHVGQPHRTRCSACDDAIEAMLRDALAGSLTSDPAQRALYVEYLDDSDDWAPPRGEPDPWDDPF